MRAAPRQPHQAGNVRIKVNREIPAAQLPVVLPAVIVKTLHRSLDKPKSSVISVQSHIAEKGIDGVEFTQIAMGRGRFRNSDFPRAARWL